MTDEKSHANEDKISIQKPSLDKDLHKLSKLEDATRNASLHLGSSGIAFLFLALAGIIAATLLPNQPHSLIIIIAAIIGGYMALNIGANDVANNVGPAVGSKALTMFGALIIAAVFESAGALLAGGDVVKTIAKGIIDPSLVKDSQTFIWAMMAALLSSALWVNLATYLRAPRINNTLSCRWCNGRRYRRCRLQCSKLVNNVSNCCQLGNLPVSWRTYRSHHISIHQNVHHLQGR